MPTEKEKKVSRGREHYERRVAQAAAAQKPKRKRKGDIDWKKEERQ